MKDILRVNVFDSQNQLSGVELHYRFRETAMWCAHQIVSEIATLTEVENKVEIVLILEGIVTIAEKRVLEHRQHLQLR